MDERAETDVRGSWVSFGAWFLVGAAYVLGLLGILTIGLPVLLAAAGATVLLHRTAWGRRGLPGLVSGSAAPLILVALLNRGGPGRVCTTAGDVTTCSERWSPWPWVAAGTVLLVAGAALFVRRQ